MNSFVDLARRNGVATLSRFCNFSAADITETCAQLNCSGEECKTVHLVEDFSPVQHYSTSPAAAAYGDEDGGDAGATGSALVRSIHLRLVPSLLLHVKGSTNEEEAEKCVPPVVADARKKQSTSEGSFCATPYSLYFPSIVPHRPVIPVQEARPSPHADRVDLKEGDKGSCPQRGGGQSTPTFRPHIRLSIREHPLKSREDFTNFPLTTSSSARMTEGKAVKEELHPSVSAHSPPCGTTPCSPKLPAVQKQTKEKEETSEALRMHASSTLPSHSTMMGGASLSSASLPLAATTFGSSSVSPPVERPSLSCHAEASLRLPPTASPFLSSSAALVSSSLGLPHESPTIAEMEDTANKTVATPLSTQRMESRREVPRCGSDGGGGGGGEIPSAVSLGKTPREVSIFDLMMISSGPPSKRRKEEGDDKKAEHNGDVAKESLPPTLGKAKKEPKKKKNTEAAVKADSSGGAKKKSEASLIKRKPLMTNSLTKLAKASGKGIGAKGPLASTQNSVGEGEGKQKSFLDEEEEGVDKEEEEEAFTEDGMGGSGDREKELYNEEWNTFSAPLALQEPATNDTIELCDDSPPFVFSRLEKPKGTTKSGKKVDAAYATLSSLPAIQDENGLQSFFHPSVLEFQQKFEKGVDTEMKIVNEEYICREVVVYRAKDGDKTLSQEEYHRCITELVAAAAATATAASPDGASQIDGMGDAEGADFKNAKKTMKRNEAVSAAPSRMERKKEVQKASEKTLSSFFSITSK